MICLIDAFWLNFYAIMFMLGLKSFSKAFRNVYNMYEWCELIKKKKQVLVLIKIVSG